MADFEFGAKLFKLGIIELLAVVHHDGVADVKATNDIGPNEGGNPSFNNRSQCLGLGILCKIIHCHDSILCLSFA